MNRILTALTLTGLPAAGPALADRGDRLEQHADHRGDRLEARWDRHHRSDLVPI